MAWNGTVEIWSDVQRAGSLKGSSEEVFMVVLHCCGGIAKIRRSDVSRRTMYFESRKNGGICLKVDGLGAVTGSRGNGGSKIGKSYPLNVRYILSTTPIYTHPIPPIPRSSES